MSIFRLSSLKVAPSGVSRTSVRATARAVGNKSLAISRSSVRATARAVGIRPLAISRSSVRATARAVGNKSLAISRTSVRACAGSRIGRLIVIELRLSFFLLTEFLIYAIALKNPRHCWTHFPAYVIGYIGSEVVSSGVWSRCEVARNSIRCLRNKLWRR